MVDDTLFWKELDEQDKVFKIGLTDKAFEIFGQIWAILPVNERKRNFAMGEPIIAIEGSDALSTITTPFNIKKMTFIGRALDRPDELTPHTPIILAEA